MFCFSRSLFPRQVNGFIVPFREDPVTEIQVHCCALNRGCDGPRSHFAPLSAPGLGALCHVVLTLASWNQSLPGIIAPVLGGGPWEAGAGLAQSSLEGHGKDATPSARVKAWVWEAPVLSPFPS